jgi:hypothetical protein
MKKDLKTAFAARKAKETEKQKPQDSESFNVEPFVKRFGQDQLEKWKSEYGNRPLIYLKIDDSLAVLRPPVADDLGEYMTAIGTNGMSKAIAMIVEQLWLDGDYALIEDEDNFIAIFIQINNILEGKKAEFFRL